MPSDGKKHIGIIGFGQIGASLVEQIQSGADLNMQIDFIYDFDPDKRRSIPSGLVIDSMDESRNFSPDLIVEAAHPEAVRRFAALSAVVPGAYWNEQI